MEKADLMCEPANFYATEHIFDIDFHPSRNVITCGNTLNYF